jgi:hypothetical protein
MENGRKCNAILCLCPNWHCGAKRSPSELATDWRAVCSEYFIATVETVFVVQVNHHAGSLLWRPRPFENPFSSNHAQVIVDAAFPGQLRLGGIPERVVSFGAFELFRGVNMGAFVTGMPMQGFAHPLRQRFELVIVAAVYERSESRPHAT